MMGACMLVRREAIDQVGFADERFFLFSEETDWQYRLREAGWKVVFFPGAECVHVRGGSHAGRLYRENLRGHLRFFAKHRGPREAERARRLLLVAMRLRGRSSVASAGVDIATSRPGSPPGASHSFWNDEHRALLPSLRDGRRPRAGVGAGSRSRRVEHRGHPGLVADADLRGTRVTFALGSSITLTIALLAVAGAAAVAAIFVRERPARESIPWRWAAGAGAALGILLWRVAERSRATACSISRGPGSSSSSTSYR